MTPGNRWCVKSALAGLLMLTVLACGAVAQPSSSPASLAPIRWGLFKNYQPVFVANAKGFFRQAGVEVNMVGSFTSGPAIVQAAGTGNVDAGHSAISGMVNAVAAGVGVIGVADSQTEFKDAPLMQWFVLNGSPINTAHDLKGKTIAVNSLSGSFYYTVLIYLQKNGLRKEDVQFVVIPHNNQEQALRSKQVDVAGLIDPYSVHVQGTGGVRVLFRGVDVLGENQFSQVFFTKEFVAKHPESVRRFVKAYDMAIEFSYAHPQETSRIMGDAIGVSADLNGTHRFTPHAKVILKDVQFWMDQMRQYGDLKDGGKLKPTDVATTSFA